MNIGFKNRSPQPFQLSYVLGVLTMVGALMSEFFLRDSPKWPLVVLAILIIIFSAIALVFLREKSNSDSH